MEAQSSVDLRANLHRMWASVADAWGAHADYLDTRGAVVSERLFELSQLGRGDRVLELACGPGSVGIAASERVGPDGEVVVSDVASEMTAIAARRAEELGLQNVRARELDLEDVAEPDASYDVVLCREGLMLVQDPGQAAREIVRVLRPGGRAAIAVWGPRERNPWLGKLLDAVSAQLGSPIPPPGVPGPFSLEDAGTVERLLSEAGLADVDVSELSVPMRVASFEEWWNRSSALAGPLAALLASMPEEAREALRARAREAIAPYADGAGFDFPGVTLVAAGQRPE